MSILECRGSLPVSRAVELMGVSRSGYYRWLHTRNMIQPTESDLLITEEIQRIALDYPRYGYRRAWVELGNRGFIVSRKKVYMLMRQYNLLCVRRRYRVCTTDSNHDKPVYENLAGGMRVSGINQLWVADITYIQLSREFVYLAVVIDVYSRRCVGWQLSHSIDTRLTLGALHNALETRRTELGGLVHHSDQGVQYASKEYVECLLEHGIRVSMSRRGNPYDNAFAESFMKTLKYEEVYLNEYETFKDAMENIERFIDEVYNQKRLHSSIGYQSPIEYEKTLNTNIVP
ncbi:putative transposase orfB for insertion sequence element [Methanocella paludicola SANAE]|uniref:Putative transposase orfB for insertion sequence element n=1 Tax=Methanocella paludicola (strain DSM 17711 / JCM 13418 / NBRC 101707 / SANAE) TaxID=304371 RepID=D1YV08_METPS|nr:putative transposase orfB for insertion sequence element [Methanocella paludicola SANAE]BAI61995.1 putative transposase orfB for insertion sequence element [Methanocella paludicola SANAE]